MSEDSLGLKYPKGFRKREQIYSGARLLSAQMPFLLDAGYMTSVQLSEYDCVKKTWTANKAFCAFVCIYASSRVPGLREFNTTDLIRRRPKWFSVL